MRTFQLIAKAVEGGEWDIQWRATEGNILPAEMHWILSVAIQVLLDSSKRGIRLVPGELIMPGKN